MLLPNESLKLFCAYYNVQHVFGNILVKILRLHSYEKRSIRTDFYYKSTFLMIFTVWNGVFHDQFVNIVTV